MTVPNAPTSKDPALQGPVLVTGGAGYIGSHTVRALEAAGVPCLVLDNLSQGHRAAVRAPLMVADLGDRDALGAIFAEHRPRSVIHFAAQTYVGESVESPAKYYLENVHYTWNLLETMRSAGCNEIVFSSTCATYGVPEAVPIDEDHPQRPISPYGRTKLHMEHMMQDYGVAYGLRHAALRYFNAAGAAAEGDIGEDHDPETHLIPIVLQVAAGLREEVAVFGDDYPTPDGTCVRDYIHVEDLARAHLAALAKLQAGEQSLALNLGTGQGYSVREVIETAREVTGKPIQVRMAARRAGDPPQLIGAGARARAALGWTPRKPELRTIVEDAWRFLQAHPKGYGDRG